MSGDGTMVEGLPALVGLPYDEYRAIRAINISTLKAMRVSPKHYRQALMRTVEDTDAMREGRVAHMAVFERARMDAEVAVWDQGTRRGKAWDAFCEDNAGKEIVTGKAYAAIERMREAIEEHELAASYLREGEPEVSLVWDIDGQSCKGRVDWLSARAIVDLKTTTDCDLPGLHWRAEKWGYYLQAAWYRYGVEQSMGVRLPFVFVWAEKVPPYDVVVMEVTDEQMDEALIECRALLARVKECEKTGYWPGRAPGLHRSEHGAMGMSSIMDDIEQWDKESVT